MPRGKSLGEQRINTPRHEARRALIGRSHITTTQKRFANLDLTHIARLKMLQKLAVVDPLLVTPPLSRIKRKREQDDPEQPPADMTRRQFEEIPAKSEGTDCRHP